MESSPWQDCALEGPSGHRLSNLGMARVERELAALSEVLRIGFN